MKLIKTENDYDLKINGRTFATTDFKGIHAGANSATKYKLSLKNCQAIENGYDLDDMSSKKYPIENTGAMFMPNRHEVTNIYKQEGFIEGAKAILEILSDKKFSVSDMEKLMFATIEFTEQEEGETYPFLKDFIQSLQQTEWDVEIVTKDTGLGARINREHKLDRDGCLILKRI